MEKLDLHGVHYEDVRRKVIHFIEDTWDSSEEIEIITGYSKTMKRIVKEILDEYNLTYEVGDFLGINNGFIRINY